jgi:hypothetical protein
MKVHIKLLVYWTSSIGLLELLCWSLESICKQSKVGIALVQNIRGGWQPPEFQSLALAAMRLLPCRVDLLTKEEMVCFETAIPCGFASKGRNGLLCFALRRLFHVDLLPKEEMSALRRLFHVDLLAKGEADSFSSHWFICTCQWRRSDLIRSATTTPQFLL